MLDSPLPPLPVPLSPILLLPRPAIICFLQTRSLSTFPIPRAASMLVMESSCALQIFFIIIIIIIWERHVLT